ncbi:unnamed protein product [Gadus morhua 'NCC']
MRKGGGSRPADCGNQLFFPSILSSPSLSLLLSSFYSLVSPPLFSCTSPSLSSPSPPSSLNSSLPPLSIPSSSSYHSWFIVVLKRQKHETRFYMQGWMKQKVCVCVFVCVCKKQTVFF